MKFFHQIGRIKGSFFNTLLKLNRLNMTSNGITKFQARDLSRNQLLGKHCVVLACLCLCVRMCICVCVYHVCLCPTKTLSSKGLIQLQISTVVGMKGFYAQRSTVWSPSCIDPPFKSPIHCPCVPPTSFVSSHPAWMVGPAKKGHFNGSCPAR